jgi:hypothetical protein
MNGMWKRGLRPRNPLSANIQMGFSLQCTDLDSARAVVERECLQVVKGDPHSWSRPLTYETVH